MAHRCERFDDQESGTALVWALLFVIVTSGMVISHTAYMAANRREMDVRFRQTTLATTFARSGLQDALAWFRRQPSQPVTTFAPLLDPGGDPPFLDTLDPVLGLVREFEVRGDLWGRYEVRKADLQDIASERGQSAAGSVWDVGSRGYLFDRRDPGKAFDEAPNRVVAMTGMRSEIRGVPLLPPAPAAVCIDDWTAIDVKSQGRVQGAGKSGFAYLDPGFLPALIGDVTGIPAVMPVVGYDATPQTVFSMSLPELRSLSDYALAAGEALPTALPDYKIVFVDGNLVLTTPLIGRLLLVVTGNLIAVAGNNSRFTGMVYVAGDATLDGPFKFKGTMVVRGQITLGNTASLAEITYDGLLVESLRRELGRYRMSRSLVPW